ncbi:MULTISPECIES: helix-turn-helix domain-containing protein [unclassified Pseudoalteromonas]|uniref:helix-turn-helix domain-containing protein n=1 Tax=unclassified Pseudoalteromonas TaxID=194690 RepID=UPI003FA7B7E7
MKLNFQKKTMLITGKKHLKKDGVLLIRYIFLIKSHDYKHEPRALDFIVHFIKHYYVAEAAGLQKAAISKMAKNNNYSTTTRTLDALCTYFDCKIEDLITYQHQSL